MKDYTQDILDLIEWANGPADSTWGSKRAAAGHPAPFNLQYLAVGNEDAQTPEFQERFKMIADAVRAKYPNITLIGNVGPAPVGPEFDVGWKFAADLKLDIVDEHYYQSPLWFLHNLNRYDSYDRSRPKVFVGEFASHGSTLAHALSEAAYMTSLERNGDEVRLASYAPLLGRIGHCQWNPDLIYFTQSEVFPTVNYYVQKLFSTNQGDQYFPTTIDDPTQSLCDSCVKETQSGDLILKLVNPSANAMNAQIQFAGNPTFAPQATVTILTGAPNARDDVKNPQAILPQTAKIPFGEKFSCDVPAYSLIVLRIPEEKQ
jgi:alpha-L-arabinofuranosidase